MTKQWEVPASRKIKPSQTSWWNSTTINVTQSEIKNLLIEKDLHSLILEEQFDKNDIELWLSPEQLQQLDNFGIIFLSKYNEAKELINNIVDSILSLVGFDNFEEKMIKDIEQKKLIEKLKSFFDDINSSLPTKDKFEDVQVKEYITKNLIKRFYQNIYSNASKIAEAINPDNLIFLEEYIDSMSTTLSPDHFVQEVWDEVKSKCYEKILSELNQTLEKAMDDLIATIIQAKKDKNIDVDISSMQHIIDSIKQLQTQFGQNQNMLDVVQTISTDFEKKYSQNLSDLCDDYFIDIVKPELEACDTESGIDDISSSSKYKSIKNKIWLIPDVNIKELLNKKIDMFVSSIKFALKNKLPQIKIIGDEVSFDGTKFPKFIKKETEQDKKTKTKTKTIENLKHKLQKENPFYTWAKEYYKKNQLNNLDIDIQEWEKEYEDYKLYIRSDEFINNQNEYKRILEARKQLEESSSQNTDPKLVQAQIAMLTKQSRELVREINSHVPTIIKYINWFEKLKTLPSWEKEEEKKTSNASIPDISSKIAIDKDMISYLKPILDAMQTQCIDQDWIDLLEWESWVGKNVLIDVIAHYLDRPVFTFACNRQVEKQDLTYLRLVDEHGTYKLNSLVYEAIQTPGAILIFDEINTLPPAVAKMLNWLFDYRRNLSFAHVNGKNKAEKWVVMFGTCNPLWYEWTEKLAQDLKTRIRRIYINYPAFESNESGQLVYNYYEAIRMYRNIPYFHKLMSLKWYSKQDIQAILYLKNRKEHNHNLTPEEESKIKKLESDTISDMEFIQAWNLIINAGQESEAITKYWIDFVNWIKDIFTLMKYADYVRGKHKNLKLWKERPSVNPFEVSLSMRNLNNMLRKLNSSDKTAKEIFIEDYTVECIEDPKYREKVRIDLEAQTF